MEPARKLVACARCGVFVAMSNRWSQRNHDRTCVPNEDVGLDDIVKMELEEGDSSPLLDAEAPVLCNEEAPVASRHKRKGHDGWADLDNFDELNAFMGTGRCSCNDAELQLIKFWHMAHSGYGCSRAFTAGMLQFSKDAGGKNMYLPDSWHRCVEDATGLIERLQGKRKTFALKVAIPEDVRILLADPSQTHIDFQFECPVTEMIRVAMFTQTCQSWDNVALSYEDNNGFLDDFCNGDRYKRIAADMSPGGAILGAVLATDGICLDKAMFDSQEVFPTGLLVLSTGLVFL